ncbi:tail fiber domain-containing protein [Bdellovibrio sp. HCB117]|uniref:tail fiber domain-containing protein n=1 Tax=Bdellovibrio sp. HCB117 TaxID=3394359 RepID=UPI0039B4AE7B
MKYTGTFLFIFLFLTAAWAGPNSLTYQGRILRADGSPLEFNNVSFQFEITSPDGLCVLYREQVNGINMTNSGGVFDVAIGSGSKSFPTDASFKLLDAFVNSGSLACYGSSNYSPSYDDIRRLRVQFHDGSGWKVISPDSEIRSVPFAGYSYSATKLGTNSASDFLLKAGIPTCASGTFLSWNGSALTCSGVAGASGGTVTDVTSANSYLTIVNGTSTPTLTLNVGTAANTVAAGNDPRLSDARIPTGAAGGDLSSTYPNPTVAKIQGVAVSTTAPNSGEYLKYNGAQWLPAVITSSDVSGLAATLSGYVTQSYFSAAVASANCAQHQTMYWEAATNSFKCLAINVSVAGDVSGSIGSVSVDKIKGVALDFSVAPTSGQTLKFNGTSWAPANDNNGGGTITALTGDVTASGSGSVTATVNSVGGSTAANIHSATQAANAATDANTASTIVKRDASGNFIANNATLNRVVLKDSGSNTVTLQAPTAVSTSYVLKFPSAQSGANQLLLNDGAGNLSWTSLSSVGVTSVGVTSPIVNSGTASAPTIGIQQANGSQAGYLSSADWTSFNSKLGTTLNSGNIWIGNGSNVATAVTPAGDVTISTTGATLVGKIQGTGVVSTTPTATNNIFKYNGTNWAPGFIGVADIRSTAAGNAQFFPTTCSAAQTLNWESATDKYICTNIAIGDSQITYASKAAKTFLAAPTAGGVPSFRTIASSDLPTTGADGAYINGGNSFGANATLGVNDAFGLDIETNNVARVSIGSTGKVGVNASGASSQLQVHGAASVQTDYAIATFQDSSNNGLSFGVDTSNGWSWLYSRTAGVSPRPIALFAHNTNQTPDLLVDNGQVGVGTGSPQAPLHVVGNANGGILVQKSSNDNGGATIVFAKSRGTNTARTPAQSGDRLMGLYGSGAYDATNISNNSAAIQFLAAENFTSTAQGTSIDFGTTPIGGTARQTRMTILPSGQIAVGAITAPAGMLSNTTINLGDSGTIAAINGNGIGPGGLQWEAAGTGYATTLFNSTNLANAHGLQLYTASSDANVNVLYARANGNARFSIKGNGYVGVNTASPRETMEINKGHFLHTGGDLVHFFNSYHNGTQRYGGYGGASGYAGGIGFSPSTGTLYLTTSSAAGAADVAVSGSGNHVQLDRLGNLGIGGGAPRKLSVTGDGAYFYNPSGNVVQEFQSAGGYLFRLQSSPAGFDIFDASSNANRLTILNNGNVGIGTAGPSYNLHVIGSAGLSSGTAWINASDIRLKDIKGDYEYGLNEILKLHTVRFNYKKGNPLGLPSDHRMTGFIAQEVQKVIPDAVRTRADGYLELNVDPIHWATVNAVQELHGICKQSEEQMKSVDARLQRHDREIASLKEENRLLKEQLEKQSKDLEEIKKKLGL